MAKIVLLWMHPPVPENRGSWSPEIHRMTRHSCDIRRFCVGDTLLVETICLHHSITLEVLELLYCTSLPRPLHDDDQLRGRR